MKLSYTSKMPCPSFALPAGKECVTGSKLMAVAGSVCKTCYARKGFYSYPSSKLLRRANLYETKKALKSAAYRKYWIAEMVKMITADADGWFRWHDSGDLLSADHLMMIFSVCDLTPTVRHWVPTREYAFVGEALLDRKMPKNCTVRLSAHMVGKTLQSEMPTSSVGASSGRKCPATYDDKHDGACMDCRSCWDRTVLNIDYKKH